MPKGDPDRSVIIDPAFLGDVVFNAPLVRALKRRNPSSRVGIVVRPPGNAVAERIRGIDRVHVFDKRGRDRGWRGLMRMAGELEKERYQVAFIPHPSLRSTLLAKRAQIPMRVGTTKGMAARWFLTERRTASDEDTFISMRLEMLDPDLAQNTDDLDLRGTLESKTERPSDSSRSRVGIVLGSQWATKRWAPEQAAKFMAGLDRDKHELVLLGADSERPIYESLSGLEAGVLDGADDLIGGGVDTLIDRIAGCDVVVAGDTGPLHMARALGIPVVGLFGPTPETKHVFRSIDEVLKIEIDCRPCSPHGPKVCPEKHHRCMKDLTSDAVRGAVTRVLARLAEQK